MFKINTPQGERYMVRLIGPSSYRMGALMAYRGQTLTVAKRTRDYLVRKTGGAWVDFDPSPQEEIEEVLPPQFGEAGGPMIDMDDIDPKANPPMSMAHAAQLAAKGSEVANNMQPGPVELDTADLSQAPQGAPEAPQESGDLSGADLKANAKSASGGAPAAPQKASGVKMTNKATTKATAKAEKSDDTAMTVD